MLLFSGSHERAVLVHDNNGSTTENKAEATGEYTVNQFVAENNVKFAKLCEATYSYSTNYSYNCMMLAIASMELINPI